MGLSLQKAKIWDLQYVQVFDIIKGAFSWETEWNSVFKYILTF